MKFSSVWLLFFLVIGSSVRAQTVLDSTLLTFEDVNVNVGSLGNHIPLSLVGNNTKIITSSDIERLPVLNSQDVLKYVIGLDSRQRGFGGVQSDIGIQGSGFDQVLVLINGVRMSDAQTGHHMMNLPIPLEAIDRIEITKGANARRYGLNAMAGVVNFITKKSVKNTLTLNGFGGSSFESNRDGETYKNQGFRVFATFNNRKANGWVSSSVDEGNGYRNNSAFSTYRNMAEVIVPLKKTEIATLIGGNNNDFGANGFYAAPADSSSHETVNTVFGNLRVVHQLGQGHVLRANIGLRNNYDHYIFRNFNPSYSQNKHTSDVLMADIQWFKTINYFNISAGSEYREEKIVSSNLGRRNRSFLGTYIDVNRKIGEFFISGGLYALNQSELGLKIYPGVEMSYKFNRLFTVYGNFGTGQRLPTFTDLYYKGPTNKSNPNLKPESAQSFEFGIRYSKNKIQGSVNVFQRNTSQLIDWTKLSIDSIQWSPVNYNKSLAKGVEFQLDIMVRTAKIQIGYCGLDINNSKEEKIISKNALNYLSHQAIMGVSFPVVKGFNVNFQARYQERNIVNEGFWLYSANVNYAIREQISLYLNFQNITNQKYTEISILPLPPRWSTFGVIVRLHKNHGKKQA